MGFNDTVKRMRELLAAISVDLEKAVGGNKAASQRVRTATIRLEKIAKNYRKESIASEKQGGKKKKAAKPAAKKAKPAAKKAKPAAKKAQAKAKPKAKTAAKARPKAKAAKVKARPRAKAFKNPARRQNTVAMKRQTARLPVRRKA